LKLPAAPLSGISVALQQATGNALAFTVQQSGLLLVGVDVSEDVIEGLLYLLIDPKPVI